MSSKKKAVGIAAFCCILIALLVGSFLTGSGARHEFIQETMRDAVLHETNQISLFGIRAVNPALISAVTVTVILLVLAALIRIFAIPHFKYVPGKFQMLLEQLVSFFDGLKARFYRAFFIRFYSNCWGNCSLHVI